jgi:hypothetical protein
MADELDREADYGQLPSVSRLIAVMRKGKVDADLTQQMADVVGMVKNAYHEGIKKAGELSIKIKVEPLTEDVDPLRRRDQPPRHREPVRLPAPAR